MTAQQRTTRLPQCACPECGSPLNVVLDVLVRFELRLDRGRRFAIGPVSDKASDLRSKAERVHGDGGRRLYVPDSDTSGQADQYGEEPDMPYALCPNCDFQADVIDVPRIPLDTEG